MKVEYLTCDLCGKTIDMSVADKSAGKIEVAKIRLMMSGQGPDVAKEPFPTEEVAKLSQTEVLQKMTIDTCQACSDKVEEFCKSIRKAPEPKK